MARAAGVAELRRFGVLIYMGSVWAGFVCLIEGNPGGLDAVEGMFSDSMLPEGRNSSDQLKGTGMGSGLGVGGGALE